MKQSKGKANAARATEIVKEIIGFYL